MPNIGEHAVVLGASMGGLLAGRVLADFYHTVTVVERDVLPVDVANRRGVPQGRHGHVLLTRGSQVLDELFPGLLDELVAAGAPVFDVGNLAKFSLSYGGHRLIRSGTFTNCRFTTVYYPSRPLLEAHVRQRVRAIPNVMILDGHDVAELTSTADRNRVTGARMVNRDDGGERALAADLVVDATGRGARTPAFLESLGYGRPLEDHVVICLVYTGQLLRIPPGVVEENVLVVAPRWRAASPVEPISATRMARRW
jgi:2-polyprenyl-6-methoxyphenol hydroxylase-like FAD-dependent oxidoreductase